MTDPDRSGLPPTGLPPTGARVAPVTRAEWQARAERELEGRPLDSLTRPSPEGIPIQPLYLRDDVAGLDLESLPGRFPYLRGRTARGPATGQGWWSVQEYRHAEPALANAAARADLERGAHACWFVLDRELQSGREVGTRADGLIIDPSEQLGVLLEGIDPTRTPVFFEAGLLAPACVDALDEWLDERDLVPDERLPAGPARGGVVYDPLSPLVRGGSIERSLDSLLGELLDRVLGTPLGLLGVSTAPYHEGGASDAEELALALSTCAEWLRRGEAFGLSPTDLAPALIWTLPIGNDLFATIAKLRAARVLWAKLARACDLGEELQSVWIHATPSQRTWTRHAPWVNLLRGTVASFAAAVGGADAIASAPFDGLCGPEGSELDGLGRGSDLGRRLAINTQVILREEAQLGRVIDPAGGSWYVEARSDALARLAWDRFRELEARGGLIAGLQAGAIQASVGASAERLRQQVATRKLAITGVSTWPVLDEQPTPQQGANEFSEAPDLTLPSPVVAPAEIVAIPRLRLAEPFERLRDASDAWAREHGVRPRIAAINLGTLAQHQARTDFSRNLFAAAGIELVELDGAEQALDRFTTSGCSLAVICGRDQDYPAFVGRLLVGLRAAGAREVWVAGRPPAQPGPDMPEPPPRYVFLGCDALVELEHALLTIGALSSEEEEA